MASDLLYDEDEVQELFDVVFKLSAKDISDKLTKVRNRPEIVKRRWFWELLQNAKDAVKHNEKVDVVLYVSKMDDERIKVKFSHNGNPFRYQDAKNLIFPYSDKEEEEDSDKSGRFGTGFLATHCLSKIIHVKGVYIKDSEAFDFEFDLDRSAGEKSELAKNIDRTWHEFRNNSIRKSDYEYNQVQFDTSFTYHANQEMSDFIHESVDDLQTSLPLALAFIPKVRSVKIQDDIRKTTIKYSKNTVKTTTVNPHAKHIFIDKHVVDHEGNKDIDEINLIIVSDGKVDLGIEIEKKGDLTLIKELPEHHPILFCPFPLIGANDFPFPVAINSESFIPKEERDGIWLGSTVEGEENQNIFELGVALFKALIEVVSSEDWKNTFLLFKTLKVEPQVSDLDNEWFKEKVQDPIKSYNLGAKLIDNENVGLVSIRTENKEVWFPKSTKADVREELWDLLGEIMPDSLPPKKEVHSWYEVLWDDCPNMTLKEFSKLIAKNSSIESLSSLFGEDEEKTVIWLDKVVSLIAKEQDSLLGETETAILPNQFGVFKMKDELYLDDGSFDEDIKEMHAETAKFKTGITDWRIELLDKRIYLNLPPNKTRTIEEISLLLVENIKDLLKTEQPSVELQNLLSRLLNWLNENPELRYKHFKGLKSDALLYKTTNEAKLKQFTELLRKDREGEISVEELANLDGEKIALLNDPNLELKLQLGEKLMVELDREKKEFEFKKKVGDIFEKQFSEIMAEDDRFGIEKVEGEEDFILTRKVDLKQFYIELKSTKLNAQNISLSHKQAKKAYDCPTRYCLCFIPNDGSEIDANYFKANARFDMNIGKKMSTKVIKALSFEEPEEGITVQFEDALLEKYKKHRYKFLVQRNILDDLMITGFFQQLVTK